MHSHKLLFWLVLITFQVSSANAATFDWSYVGTGGSSNVGGGELVATPQTGDAFLVTSITGKANGQTITELGSDKAPDQLVFSPSPPDIALDSHGISFSTGIQSFNLYEDSGLYLISSPYTCNAGLCISSDFVETVDFSLTPVSTTPLPAALPLFATALGLMGLFSWRRKRRALLLARFKFENSCY